MFSRSFVASHSNSNTLHMHHMHMSLEMSRVGGKKAVPRSGTPARVAVFAARRLPIFSKATDVAACPALCSLLISSRKDSSTISDFGECRLLSADAERQAYRTSSGGTAPRLTAAKRAPCRYASFHCV